MIPHPTALQRFDKRKSAVSSLSQSQATQSQPRQRRDLPRIEEENAVVLDADEGSEEEEEEEEIPASAKKRKRTGRR